MDEAPAVIKNIKTDFGAACNGIDSDYAAFQAFNAWALEWQQSHSGLIQLDIPSGSVCMFSQSGQGSWFAKGIEQLVVKGYGATLSDNNGAGGGFFLGGGGIESGNGGFGYTDSWTARAATVSAGSDSITLLDPSQTSIFSVGTWALITGLDLMGYGFPPDPQFFEYVEITAINPTTGQVTFAAPLKNGYESTWPNYWSGTPGLQADQGGPATLYVLDPSWDTEVEYDGLTINQAGQTYANGRSVTFKDCNFNDGALIPSQNMTWTLQNVNMPNSVIEVDKLVTTMNVTGGTLRGLAFQSASVDTLNMNGTTVSSFINGTPKTAYLSNDNIANLGVGAYAYGASSEVICTDCVLGSITAYGVYENGDGSGVQTEYSMSNGVITSPNSNGPLRWAVPGSTVIWSGRYEWQGEFKVLDVTQDANNTYVKTTMSDGFPSLGAVNLSLRVDPAVQFTCIDCTGSPEALSLSQAPAGAPLYSYSNNTYTGNFGDTPSFEQWGELVSIKINVIKPYTGSKPSLDVEALGQFGAFVLNPDGSISRIDPTINLKVAGERYITPTSVTGLQPGDNISAPGPISFTGLLNAFMGLNGTLADISADDPSTWPSVSIEIVTDRGYSDSTPPPPAVTVSLENDSGFLAIDNITSDPTLTGSGDPNAIVRFAVDGTAISATAIADSTGAWTYALKGLADGLHTVTSSETNAAGSIETASLTFMLDTTAPVLTPVADQTYEATSNAGSVATFAATATDVVDGADQVVFKEGNRVVYSGDIFSIGTHSVTAVATDSAGNTATESFTIKVVDMPLVAPPVATINDHSLHTNEWHKVQGWLSVTDAITQYQFWDSGADASSGYFWTPDNAHQPAGVAITVSAAELGNVWVRGGQAPGSETMWVRASDGSDWSDWDSFNFTTLANTPLVLAVSDQTLRPNEWHKVQDWLSVTDAITQYQFWDSGADASSGYFWTPDNAHQPAGVAITVSAAELGNVWVRGGQAPGSETMWVRASDGSDWSDWDSFNFTTLANTPLVLAVSDQTLRPNEWQQAQDWFSATDADGDAITQYQFWDSGADASSGYFWTPDNPHHAAETVITVNAADLDNVWFRGGQVEGPETLWVQAFDGTSWSQWLSFSLTTELV